MIGGRDPIARAAAIQRQCGDAWAVFWSPARSELIAYPTWSLRPGEPLLYAHAPIGHELVLVRAMNAVQRGGLAAVAQAVQAQAIPPDVVAEITAPDLPWLTTPRPRRPTPPQAQDASPARPRRRKGWPYPR